MKLIKKYWAPLFLLLTTIFFLRKLLFYGEIFATPGFGMGDYIKATVPLVDYLTKHFMAGHFPLWQPETFTGFPYAANGESGLFYPLVTLLSLVFPSIWALNLYAFFTFISLGFSTYLFLKSLKLSESASLVASLSFTFSAGITSRIIHLVTINTIALLPLSLFLTEKFFTSKKPLYLILTVFVLSSQFLNYNPQTTLLCYLGFSAYFLFKTIFFRYKIKISHLLLAHFLVYLLAIMLSAIQLLPNLQLWQLSPRKTGVSTEQASEYPFYFQELAYFIKPTPLGDPSLGNYDVLKPLSSIFWENNGYLGIAALVFGLLALIFLSFKKKTVLFFSLLFISSLILALGKFTPFFFILRIPPFSFFRVHGRFVILCMLSLTVLSAYGFEIILQRFNRQRWLITLVTIVIILVDLFSFSLFYNPSYPAQKLFSKPKAVEFIKKDKSFFRIFTIFDYDAYDTVYPQFRGWRKDFTPYFNLRESLTPDLNLLWGLNQAEGFYGLIPERFVTWQNKLSAGLLGDPKLGNPTASPFFLKMLRLKNIKYVISSLKFTNSEFILRKTIDFETKQPSYYLYELTNPFPHTFIVHQAKKLDSSQVFQEIEKESFNPLNTVILEEDFGQSENHLLATGDRAEIIDYQPEKVVIKAKTNAAGFLILTDTNFPGWQAKIDDQPTKIYQANYLFRVVKLNPGKHQITFEYRPTILYLGAMISLGTLILLFILIVYLTIKKVVLN